MSSEAAPLSPAAQPGRTYPRVLIISKVRVTERDSSGASFGKWFAGWPAEAVGQIYSGGPKALASISGEEYALSTEDRHFGALFQVLKRSPLGAVSRPVLRRVDGGSRVGPLPGLRRVAGRVSAALAESGVWELMFKVRPSRKMLSWLAAFDPDVIFAQPSDLSFMWLILELERSLQVPVCLFMSDDFPDRLHGMSITAPLLRAQTRRLFVEMATRAAWRFASGPLMQHEYAMRYGLEFRPLMMCDDSERFRSAVPRRLAPVGTVSVVYAGGLAHERWRSLVELNQAAQHLRTTGLTLQIHVLTPFVVPEAEEVFRDCENMFVHPSVPDAEVPSVLKGADILFLCEDFGARAVRNVQFSLSSKAHLYMASQRPCLAYGPPGVGIIEYARDEGWALVVDRPGAHGLAVGVRRLIEDRQLTAGLLARGRSAFAANHEGVRVRENLRETLQRLALERMA